MPRYDLDLFLKLNDDWRDRPVVARPRRNNDPAELTEQARRRASFVAKFFPLEGKRVLEIGCGRGSFVKLLNDEYRCEATGLDMTPYDEWGRDPRFVHGDITSPPSIGGFDVIVSHAVWEHVRHPYTALVHQRQMLNAGGVVYLYANLYRGSKASHRYRDVYFPWPHLLFRDDVFEAFYEYHGREPKRAAWVNYLTYAQYVAHFERIGYGIQRAWPSKPWWDEQFYQQHWDLLGRYPEWDLRHDFIHAVLRRDRNEDLARGTARKASRESSRERELQEHVRRLEKRVQMMESSRSWRFTAPLRAFNAVMRRR